MNRITDQNEIGAENAAWRAYLQSRHAHHATDAFRAGWEAGRDWARENPAPNTLVLDTANARMTPVANSVVAPVVSLPSPVPHAADCRCGNPNARHFTD